MEGGVRFSELKWDDRGPFCWVLGAEHLCSKRRTSMEKSF